VLPTPFRETVAHPQNAGIGFMTASGIGLIVRFLFMVCVHVPMVPVIVKIILEAGKTTCTAEAGSANGYPGAEDHA
jgi:hypothetical protein